MSKTASPRLHIEVHSVADDRDAMKRDVRDGLGRRPYRLPPVYFYDDVGSRLFDAICDTPEYYLTREESALLAVVAPSVIAASGATDLVELGSGAARKTTILLDALVKHTASPRYVPLDVSESMLRRSADSILLQFPTLSVHGIVGDYERHLGEAPKGGRRLVAFLGSSIGNFAPGAAESFLGRLGAQLQPGDRFLLGADLVKDVVTLERAYDDAAGITAAFNRNVLAVLNRELGGDFDPSVFAHVAFYNASAQQIEMHLRALHAHTAHIRALGLDVPFEAGETIHTEISRKFTRESVEAMLDGGGFELEHWYTTPGETFALALARVNR